MKSYAIGYFHIDTAEVRTEDGKLHMFAAIDRSSKFVFVELHERATRSIACQFLSDLIKAVPYQIHTVLTDNSLPGLEPGASSFAIRRTTVTGRQPATWDISSTGYAQQTGSSTA